MPRRDTAWSRELSLIVCSVWEAGEDRTCKVRWVAVLCACERTSKISSLTEYQMVGRNMYHEFNVSHLVQCITSTLPFSFTRACFEANADLVLFPPPEL
jgi:hypothetical protein